MKIKIQYLALIILIIAVIVGYTYFTPSLKTVNPNPDTFSTYGPTAPPIDDKYIVTDSKLQTLSIGGSNSRLLNVPEYDWQHGCGPTAIGMLLGYYDLNFNTTYLGHGDPSIQAEVNEKIASTEHYNDYSLPIDNDQIEPIPDKSETGNPHSDNSIADTLQTSVSKRDLLYGWSYTHMIDDTIEEYSSKNGKPIPSQYYDNFDLSDLKNEINHNRPFIVFMNADGIGGPDHFATCVGYNSEDLIIHTTWAGMPTIQTPLYSANQQFGIQGVIFTNNAATGEGVVSTPGFELVIFIISLIATTLYVRHKKW